eukprot:CAMPEP_0194280646 /NCGR_PEP_ID=MMETSP0169-20130528/18144_1 /TAXON_ID=218684 /ORGANISM="Corethron pennatum, Strain L29A3" /LENGTH=203 /DNA_ID=CAMNT_0039025439 /DNA_START=34 /DNA_END=645 /DNA_ORIENTATION=-
MKLIVASLFAGSAAAFAPASQMVSSSAVSMSFENELGAQPPLGCFDPLGLLEDADQDRFDRLRFTELKHGRVCMLAFLGQITTRSGIHLKGDIDYSGTSFDSIGNGWAALEKMPQIGLVQMIAFVGFLELFVMRDSANGAEPGDFVGDFRNGYLDFGWDRFDEETKMFKRAAELNNGRAAMLGILGLMVHEQLGTNMPVIGQL